MGIETKISRPAAVSLVAVLAAVSFVGLAVDGVPASRLAVATLRDPDAIFAGDEVEIRTLKKSRTGDLLRPYWAATMLSVFDETQENVLVGPNGYLFFRPGLAPVDDEAGGPDEFRSVLELVTNLSARAGAAGARFHVLLMPSKWRLCEDELPKMTIDPGRRRLYARARAALLARKLSCPDILTILEEIGENRQDITIFPATDSHLTQAAFGALTERLAVETFGLTASDVSARLDAVEHAPVMIVGDLIDLCGIPRTSPPSAHFAHEDVGLDPPACADVGGSNAVLVGDSFFAYYDHLWPRLIQAASSMTVDARATGPDFFDRMDEVVNDYGPGRLPQVVILAVSERRFADEL